MALRIVPTTDPLCRELQGGHSSFRDGLLLSPARHTVTPDGEWVIDAAEFSPNPDQPLANVHTVLDAYWMPLTHNGLRVYGIRFWQSS
jgi:hypothetical protein